MGRSAVDCTATYDACQSNTKVGGAIRCAAPSSTTRLARRTAHPDDADADVSAGGGLRPSRTSSAQATVFAISGERHDGLDGASGSAGFFVRPVDLDAPIAALATLPRRVR